MLGTSYRCPATITDAARKLIANNRRRFPKEILPSIWTVRGGIFFDQEPASGRPTEDRTLPGDGNPDNFYGFAVGVGLQALQRLNFDMAYQFRYGNNVNSDFIRGVPGFSEDVRQHRFLMSAILYF